MRIGFLATLLLLVQTATAQTADNHLSYPPMDPGGEMDLIETATESEELFVRRRLVFQDADLQAIIDRVLADVTPDVRDTYINYRVHLIRDPSPLGFSFADGQIYLNTGLLARLENEAQLAAVIAHEAHHVATHDHITATRARRKKGGIVGAATILGGGSMWDTRSTNELLDNLRNDFSDEQEIAADSASVALITIAGYPPSAAVKVLEHVMKDPELSTPSLKDLEQTKLSISGSKTTEQIIDKGLQARYEALKQRVPVGLLTTAPRPLLLRQIIEMTIDDYIRLDRPGTAVEFIDELIALQPDAFLLAAKGDSHVALGPRPVREDPEKWHFLTGDRRDLTTREERISRYMETEEGPPRLVQNTTSAIEAYNNALQMDENMGRAYRGLGNVYFDQEDYRQSGRNYLKYLKLTPEAIDRNLIVEKLQHIRDELSAQKETQG
jgi:tetratricopeptide (TPR) repeat protein